MFVKFKDADGAVISTEYIIAFEKTGSKIIHVYFKDFEHSNTDENSYYTLHFRNQQSRDEAFENLSAIVESEEI